MEIKNIAAELISSSAAVEGSGVLVKPPTTSYVHWRGPGVEVQVGPIFGGNGVKLTVMMPGKSITRLADALHGSHPGVPQTGLNGVAVNWPVALAGNVYDDFGFGGT